MIRWAWFVLAVVTVGLAWVGWRDHFQRTRYEPVSVTNEGMWVWDREKDRRAPTS